MHTPEHLLRTTRAVVWNVPQSPCVKAWSPAIEIQQDLSRWGLVEGSWAACSYHLKGLLTQKSLCLLASRLDGWASSLHTSASGVTCFAVSEPKKQDHKLQTDSRSKTICFLSFKVKYIMFWHRDGKLAKQKVCTILWDSGGARL